MWKCDTTTTTTPLPICSMLLSHKIYGLVFHVNSQLPVAQNKNTSIVPIFLNVPYIYSSLLNNSLFKHVVGCLTSPQSFVTLTYALAYVIVPPLSVFFLLSPPQQSNNSDLWA